jgi:hypothetical protein
VIVRVALKRGDTVLVGEPGWRHDSVIHANHRTGEYSKEVRDIQGFVTDTGEFMDRKQAAEHAYQCGQIKERVFVLFSEDVW